MKIKINGKKTKIKPFSELTVAEYSQFWARVADEEPKTDISITLLYLSVITRRKVAEIASERISDLTILRLKAYIGEMLYADDLPEFKAYICPTTGKVHTRKSLDWQAVGVRLMLAEFNIDNRIDTAAYTLAVMTTGNYDSQDTAEAYEAIKSANALEVLGFANFFLKKLKIG